MKIKEVDYMTKFPDFKKGYKEPVWSKKELLNFLVEETNEGTTILNRSIQVNNKIEDAKEILEKQITAFDNVNNRLVNKQKEVEASAKQVSTKIRDSAEKLNQGMARIEKLANFDRLERIVNQLERIELALSSLAKLEQEGKLDKIINAMK